MSHNNLILAVTARASRKAMRNMDILAIRKEAEKRER
tara:strand:+ start:1322 stop:1432 length:111 start_codon:yes stop_codon:yes gene_type:complete